MGHEPSRGFEAGLLHPTLRRIVKLLNSLGLRVFIIGARSIMIHGVDLGRETRDWDIAIDRPFVPELRDEITRLLRGMGYRVQWRKGDSWLRMTYTWI